MFPYKVLFLIYASNAVDVVNVFHCQTLRETCLGELKHVRTNEELPKINRSL